MTVTALPVIHGLYLEPYDPSDHEPLSAVVNTPPKPTTPKRPQFASVAAPTDPIPKEDRVKYNKMFASCNPVNGELEGTLLSNLRKYCEIDIPALEIVGGCTCTYLDTR